MNNTVYTNLADIIENGNKFPFHITDIAGDIIEDGSKKAMVQNITTIVELENILAEDTDFCITHQMNMSGIMTEYKNAVSDNMVYDLDHTIFVVCATTPEQVEFFSFMGFCSINARCGLENRTPMVYSINLAGKQYMQLARYIVYRFSKMLNRGEEV